MVDLPAARLAHQPERLALVDGERHAVDGLDVPRDPLEKAPVDGKVHLEVFDLEQRLAPCAWMSLCGARPLLSRTAVRCPRVRHQALTFSPGAQRVNVAIE